MLKDEKITNGLTNAHTITQVSTLTTHSTCVSPRILPKATWHVGMVSDHSF